jgi:hypothetical protein
MPMTCKCCGNLVDAFKFEDLTIAAPPLGGGVYVLRVAGRGKPIQEITASSLLQQMPQVWDKYAWCCNQVRLVERIDQCSLLYIGKASSLARRLGELAWAHPALWPVAALLMFGWKLEYGWLEDAAPLAKEKELKKVYRNRHDGRLPALVRQ